jgi:hypothetical protein
MRVKVELSSAIATLHGRVTASMNQPAGAAQGDYGNYKRKAAYEDDKANKGDTAQM